MLDEKALIRIEAVRQNVSLTSIDSNLKSHGTSNCPFCHRRAKAYVYHDKYFKCFSSVCGIQGDVIKINSLLHQLSYFQSLAQLEQQSGLTQQSFDIINERTSIYEQALDIYKYVLDTQDGVPAREYLHSRGFDDTSIKMYDIGFAPPTNVLKSYGLDSSILSKHFLLTDYGEYFSNRIIFPLRDQTKRVVHFVGRYCGKVPKDLNGDDAVLRYKDSKASNSIPTTKAYLAFEDYIEEYHKLSDFTFLSEGYPDSLMLKQLGLPSLGILGLEGLTKQYHKLSGFSSIICVFDNDYFPHDFVKEELRGQYKSWVKLIPQLIELQQILPQVKFYTWMIPDMVNGIRVKDINEYLMASKINKSELLTKINNEKQDLVLQVIERWGSKLSHHQTLLQLISSTNRGKSSLAKFVSDELQFSDPISYALKVLGS